ncbi:sigma-70 family RNA polymerase sigma factor [Streptomyces sp. RLB1-33]|uniref:sigma-70 family RNA polymerase sigma factor n=1 Tax=Streptomyces mirabilis TaxID=68239 RepID=UPI00143EF2EC|nr:MULTISPECIES: sigma-70 family RNA polymerase sigma factor [Streptomyces]QIY71683.1 sigma-70 family RNA polymerase sigma factor [Streptomyces sp. RLB1-33]QUW81339.1 sigma-70 family RNA polymerase sigma factor [Streptomyces mirabilis]
MAAEEDTRRTPQPPTGPLTEAQAERMFADMNDVIRAGEEMRRLRAEMIKLFAGLGWTQDRIAHLTGMSQPAVSKQVTKHKGDDPSPPPRLSLDQHDTPWLQGRLWGLAEEISETLHDTAHCTRHLNAVARGKKHFTPQSVDELRRLVEEDLRLHRATLPGGHRHAYDEISRALDLPGPTTANPTESASVRRTLARQIQRANLREDA